ncbi:MAG: site-specific tyrosine recombinase/integron integrase [Dehalococcoidia bacterium]
MATEPVAEGFGARVRGGGVTPAGVKAGGYPSVGGTAEAPTEAAPFDDLLDRYQTYLRGQRGLSENTVRVYTTDLESFRKYLAQENLSLTDMDRPVLRSYLAWLATEAREVTSDRSARNRKEGYARVSIVRKLTALRSFYRFLVQLGYFWHSPVPAGRTFQVKVEKSLPTFLGKQEVDRLLDTPEDDSVLGLRDRAILEVLYSCGVRLAEIQELDLENVNFSQRQILVRGKGSKERWVLFGEPTEAALRRYLQESRPQLMASDTPALFLNRYGDRLSRRSIEKLVRGYSARAGLREGIHPHTLRHTFASHMLEGDADLRVIQELLGHSSPTTTQIYTHVTKQEARSAYLNFHPRAG